MQGFQSTISIRVPFRYFTPEHGLPAPTVKALLPASDDSIWIGTKGKGIVQLKDGEITPYDHLDGLVHDQVRAITRHARASPGLALGRAQAGSPTVNLPTLMRMMASPILPSITFIRTLRECFGLVPTMDFLVSRAAV